jgi:hypothetical protein
MSPREDEREIARLLEDARRADESSAPPFREVLARRRSGEAPRRRLLWRPALLAVTVVLIVAALQLRRATRPTAQDAALPATARAIASWKAPTDVLLQTPGSELLSRSPVLVPPSQLKPAEMK